MYYVEDSEGERGEGGKKRSRWKYFLGLFSLMHCVEEWIGVGLRVGEGGGKKNGVGRIFSKVILIDALSRGWMEEWNGVGLRVGMGVY